MNTLTGQKAEEKARQFLKKQHLHYITKNYRSRFGEIDLIFHDNEDILIIEVKYLHQSNFCHPAEKVTLLKQKKITLTTMAFLKQYPKWENYGCRFDVITIEKNKIQWIKNAFEAQT